MNDHVGGTALIDSGGGEDRSAPSVMRYPVNAVIGWNPGRGDTLKKNLRIVNKNPQRYATVLIDLLRFVLQECRIKTSPQELLKQVFNAVNLTAELDEIITGVKGCSTIYCLTNAIVFNLHNGHAESMDARIQNAQAARLRFPQSRAFSQYHLFHFGGLDLYPERLKKRGIHQIR
ncbi:hypothetical protein [Pseudomonas quasicaspiana]|uniref:hypothetical protein n=1 Tax=Pseudomonas quasicaspiana TaxID=2829821 RepID=UPI001E421D94|nr:hypothetical protein [Pseudomonas quasicaspiana]